MKNAMWEKKPFKYLSFIISNMLFLQYKIFKIDLNFFNSVFKGTSSTPIELNILGKMRYQWILCVFQSKIN